MCGLIGMASTVGLKNAFARKAVLQEGLMVNSVRGDHSTGFAAFMKDKEDSDFLIYKKAYNGADFVQFPRVKSVLQDIEKYSCFIGHNRAATAAAVNHQNAHPFQFGHIILAHNGHINNSHAIIPQGHKCLIEVDSARLALAMSIVGEKEAIEQAQGGFALTWFNTKDKTLNFARNSQRPLKFVYIKGENTMFWASERQMLVWLMSRDDRFKHLEIDGKFKNVKEGVWYKFSLDDLREYKTVNFQYRPGPSGTGRDRTSRSTGTGSPAGGHAGSSEQRSSESKTTPLVRATAGEVIARAIKDGRWEAGVSTSRLMNTVIPDILEDISVPEKEVDKRFQQHRKNSGRPTKRRGVEGARKALSRLGFKYDQHVLFSAESFHRYKNQDNLGKASGVILNTPIRCDVSNLTHDEYITLSRQSVVLAKVVNFHTGTSKKDRVLMLELDARGPEFNVEWSKRRDERLGKKTRDAVSASTDSSSGNAVLTQVFCGPGHKLISQDKYDELGKHGCGWCQASLPKTPLGSQKVVWLDDSPICEDCAKDPKTQKDLQISPNILH